MTGLSTFGLAQQGMTPEAVGAAAAAAATVAAESIDVYLFFHVHALPILRLLVIMDLISPRISSTIVLLRVPHILRLLFLTTPSSPLLHLRHSLLVGPTIVMVLSKTERMKFSQGMDDEALNLCQKKSSLSGPWLFLSCHDDTYLRVYLPNSSRPLPSVIVIIRMFPD